MNVLLIRHPTTHFKNTAPPVSGIPLGILYVAASLRKAGHDVQVYDAIVDADENRWAFRVSDDICSMGATEEEIKQVILKNRPDVVGIGNQYTAQVRNALRTAEIVKKVSKDIKVVIGGPHASVMPETFFNGSGLVDYAVMGEGEVAMVELLDSFSHNRDIKSVKGIAYTDSGELMVNEKRHFVENLDGLPLPAYDLVNMERYFYFNEKGRDGRESYRYKGSERSVSVITSRGCPFNCLFCSIHLGMGRKFRAHSAKYVMEHIELLKEKYNVNHIHFEDDNISFDMPRFENIIEGIIAQNFNITWDTPNGVRADYLNENILEKCKSSGCTYLRIGVESANEHVSREIIRKSLEIDKVKDISAICNKIGIDLEAFYIIGFPGEKIFQMKETVDFAVRQERLNGLYPYSMFTATPLIGTDLYRIAREKGYISKDISPESLATATQGEGMIKTEDFFPEDLRKLLADFRLRHNIARVIFSAKFLLKHPGYFLIRLRDNLFVRQMVSCIMKLDFRTVIAEFFLCRYKNCVMRKVGMK